MKTLSWFSRLILRWVVKVNAPLRRHYDLAHERLLKVVICMKVLHLLKVVGQSVTVLRVNLAVTVKFRA